MTNPQDEDQDRTEPAQPSMDNGDAARQVTHLTGMTPEAAEAYTSYHSGRFAHSSAFRRAA